MATTTKQRLALAICDFLSTSLTDGTLSSEDKDSIDVAINCIGESFKVDPTDPAALSAATGTQNLLQIYGVYEKLKSTTAAAKPTSNTADTSDKVKEPTDDEKARAEDLKARGNRAMASKDYPAAIDLYTQALALNPRNAIYLSNRAAAYSAARDHASARADAETAVSIDPKYTKAWSRLGLARFALGDAKGSMDAYRQGIEHEGNGGSEAMKKGFETAKRRVDELEVETADAGPTARGGGGGPDLGSLASLFGGGGGGGGNRDGAGGGGGLPDLSSIMSNPMFASMAQNLMSNPDMMQNLMSNPRLREMADRFSSGGGMPDLGSLMSDPNIADMARNMMGGGGGGADDGSNPGAGRGAGR
ncbi:Small glutamine-rich tetratricopeptide repeat-containing protein 2 [Daldinia childiae]|uniref:Small glutamine-rich tetratricopeptide repeat-containing protein 2 n=1 Tax=Daldinia childiae TaxID=326645 RepID=UPI0014476DAE|nr:Small glutamine-rich tetratricopeptide repeat-containing protein 2 [Daldinia childiae]KAF3059354.1 Small glutamine-rich tetratricopeptide repeat-containing protein 2 [Daldinia childiae]